MKLMILLVGMVMILEGMPYVAAPQAMKEWLVKISEMDTGVLRTLGLVSMLGGLFICWLAQGTTLFG